MKYTLLALPFILFGCASNGIDKNYEKYLDTQAKLADRPQQPLLRIKAQEGATIQMSGVDEFTVFAPTQGNQTAAVQQYIAPRNDTAEIMKSAFGVVGTVGGIWAAGNAAKGLATAVGNASNHGYQYIQAPQANQSISGSGVIGSGSFTSNVTTTTETLSGSGVLGSGSMLSGSGTMGAGAFTTNANPVTTTTLPVGP